MKMMEVWHPRIQLHNVISKEDILNLRIKLANQIFFSKLNAQDKTIVSEFFGDVSTPFFNFLSIMFINSELFRKHTK